MKCNELYNSLKGKTEKGQPLTNMTKIKYTVIFSSLWVMLTINPSGLQASTCPRGPMEAALQPVYESPAGAVNGWNTTFMLSTVPESQRSLRVYRNGTLLLRGADYRLDGKQVEIAAPQTPQAGDILCVSYLGTSAPASSLGQMAATTRTAPLNRQNADETTIAAMRSALNNELRDYIHNRRLQVRDVILQRAAGTSAGNRYASLDMLAARMNRNSQLDAQGVEGLGDITPPAPMQLGAFASVGLPESVPRSPKLSSPIQTLGNSMRRGTHRSASANLPDIKGHSDGPEFLINIEREVHLPNGFNQVSTNSPSR
jgi:hypothetical protein